MFIYRPEIYYNGFTPLFGFEITNLKPRKFHIWHVRCSVKKGERINPAALKCLLLLKLHRINWLLWGNKYKTHRITIQRIPSHLYTGKPRFWDKSVNWLQAFFVDK